LGGDAQQSFFSLRMVPIKIVKFLVKRSLLAFNLDVRRVASPSGVLGGFEKVDPITFQYLADLKIAPEMEIDISLARAGMMGFSYGPQSRHPLVLAVLAGKAEENVLHAMEAVRDVLSTYYEQVRPSAALEIVDLTEDEAPGLRGIPVHHWVAPWSERSIEGTAMHRRISLEEEGLKGGTLVSLADGATMFGPVSDRKLELETRRIVNLSESMKLRGFERRSNHPIEVVGLRSGEEYRWFLTQGQHRVAACAAFAIDTVHTRVVRIIRREDTAFWPHVVSKTFTVTGALKCFDRLFQGGVGSCAASWDGREADAVPPFRKVDQELWTTTFNQFSLG
jgi:hypothetical protein